MVRVCFSLIKNNKFVLFSIFIIVLLNLCIICSASSYIPYPPSGETNGIENIEYEYKVNTIEVGSFWKFDWGDGTFSSWIEVDGVDSFISAKHSWSESGEYEVRVRHKSVYSIEGTWSSPLIVAISEQTDNDGDGWKNDVEESYGKDPEDPEEYPIDTDYDGIPDENSLDGLYSGDEDDDNDGLSDIIENSIGSDPKNNDDVLSFVFENNIFYIVKTNHNNYILYNSVNEKKTNAKYENGVYYIDINGDGIFDYSYDGVLKECFNVPWLYVIIGLIISIAVVLFVLFKKGILFIYEEEIVEKK